jgi:WD40 repeat protein
MLGKTNIRNGDRTIPPGALISFLQKGLQYVGIEESLHRESKKAQKNKTDVPTPEDADFSLLSPQVMAALTRTNPPIQLNLPPAAAAAAVKARLETQAKIQAEIEDKERKADSSASGSNQLTVPQQHTLDQNPSNALSSREALVAQAAAAQAVAAAQAAQLTQAPSTTQQRVEGDSQQALAAIQLALQQQQQQEPLDKDQEQEMSDIVQSQQRSDSDSQGMQAISSSSLPPAKVAKRNKKKASKKAQQQQQLSPGSNPLHLISQASATPGFATLEEAVARLEASKNSTASNNSDSNTPQPMDVDDTDTNKESTSKPNPDATKDPQEPINGLHPQPPNGSRSNDQLASSQVNGSLAALSGLVDSLKSPKKSSMDARSMNDHDEPAGALSSQPSNVLSENEIDREDRITNASAAEILELRMHSSEVFMCAWNPVFTSFIATGSGDASARIWQMGGGDASAGLGPVRLLPHGEDPRDRKNKDVTTLEWSSDGKLLATGSYDGVARVWSRNGALLHTLRGHKGPIFSLKWNRKGNYLLSGSYDKTTIVWDVSGSTGFVEQQFSDHQAPALDVDWKDDTTFASCSTDKTVNICKVGVSRPLKTYSGHTDEVNAVKWDPSGTLLASCSDDCTAKVWDVSSDLTGPLQDFKSHRQEIYTVKW